MKQVTTLAGALAVIARGGSELETQAEQVLKIVKAAKLNEPDAFKGAVRAAYKANGWNATAGKPKAGSKLTPVPATVKQYVSQIKSAFKFGLLVTSYSSFYALRKELKEKRAKLRKKVAKAIDPKLVGIRLVQPDEINGAPFHDLVALYNGLDRSRKPRLAAAVTRVVREFAPAAPQLELQSLPEYRKAA